MVACALIAAAVSLPFPLFGRLHLAGASVSSGLAGAATPATVSQAAGSSGATTAPTTPDNPASFPVTEELPFPTDAEATLLADAETGQVLAGRNADQALPLASVTKLMTLRLVFKALRAGTITLDQKVTVSAHVETHLPPYSSRMFLEAGDEVTVRQLIYGAAVPSGNDACIALAELLAGTEKDFVQQMNAEAASLGLTSAHFVDPHGYSAGDRMSARDVARLAVLYLRESPEALAYHSTQESTYAGITQYNHNILIFTYAGCDGLKTGYTSEAGFNLVATAKRGESRLIAIVLGVPTDVPGWWSGSDYRDDLVARILDWGFGSFSRVEPIPAGSVAVSLPLYKGVRREVPAFLAAPAAATVPTGKEGYVSAKLELESPYLVAPVAKGQRVGTAVILVGDLEISRVDLVAVEDVGRAGLARYVWDTIRLMFRPGP